MKCIQCGTDRTNDMDNFCQVCGTAFLTGLTVAGDAELKTAMRSIINDEGKAIIKDDKRKLIALLRDKAPNFPNQIIQLDIALTGDVIQLLLEADVGDDDTKKFNAIYKIINKLINKLGMQRSNAIAIVSYLAYGFDWNITIIEDFAQQLYQTVPPSPGKEAEKQEDRQTSYKRDQNNQKKKINRVKENTNNRPAWERPAFKNRKLTFLFWHYQGAFIVAFSFALLSVVLLANNIWQAGLASIAASAFTPLLNILLKNSYEKVVEGEIKRESDTSSAHDDIERLDFLFGQADYFAFKISPDEPTNIINAFRGVIESQASSKK